MQQPMTISALFRDEPPHWGYRGDPYLWHDLKSLLGNHPYPATEEDFLALIEQTYAQLMGGSIEDQASMIAVYVERYDHGGMSGGQVSPQFWIETGIPLLLARYRAA